MRRAMKTTPEEREGVRPYWEAVRRDPVGERPNLKMAAREHADMILRLLDDADELARLREGLRGLERMKPWYGGDLVSGDDVSEEFQVVRWSDIEALLGGKVEVTVCKR